jgi:hypothetical protein
MLLKTNRRFSKSFIIIIILCALAAGAFVFWNIYKYKFIKGKAKDAVFENSHGLYALHYGKIEVDETAGYLHVTDLTITPDTALYKKMIAGKTNPPLLLQLTIPELRVTGVKTPEAMLSKKLEGRRVEINNAIVSFYYAKGHPDTTKAEEEMYQQILGSLKLIQVDTVDIINASLAFIDIRNDKKMIEASDISVQLRDVLVDSLHSNDNSRFFFAKKVHIKGDKGIVRNKQGTYIYYFNGIDFASAEKTFAVKELKIEPQLKEAEFARFSKLQKDRFNFSFNDISLKNINLPQLMQAAVIADTLLIKQSNFKIYRDLSYPRDTKSRVGTYPQQLLMELPVDLSIRSVILRNAFIEYKEKNPKSDYSGKVQFDHAGATIANVTNLASEIKSDHNCILDFNASFLDMAQVRAKITMFLNDPRGRFSVTGSLDAFDAPKLNVLLEPMALARIDRGRVNKLDFNLACHDYGSDGKLLMLYDDLKISLLRKDSVANTLEKKGLASFVANVVIKNANPLRKQDIRRVDVHYKRDTNRSFFNLIWKSIFTGAKESVGMKK